MDDCYRSLLSLQNAFIEIQTEYLILLAAYNHFLCEGNQLLPKDKHCSQKTIDKLQRIDVILEILIKYNITIDGHLNRLNGLGIVTKSNSYIDSHDGWVYFLQRMEKGNLSPIFTEIKRLSRNNLFVLFNQAYLSYNQFVIHSTGNIGETLLLLGAEIEKIMLDIKITRIIYEYAEDSSDNSLYLSFTGRTGTKIRPPVQLCIVK